MKWPQFVSIRVLITPVLFSKFRLKCNYRIYCVCVWCVVRVACARARVCGVWYVCACVYVCVVCGCGVYVGACVESVCVVCVCVCVCRNSALPALPEQDKLSPEMDLMFYPVTDQK
jgi:hypothetical protein